MSELEYRLRQVCRSVVYAVLLVWFYLSVTTIYVDIPKLEQQINQQTIQDSLKIESLKNTLSKTNLRIDTVFIILNDEIRPELTFNAGVVDSLGDYAQTLNIRTAPLINYKP